MIQVPRLQDLHELRKLFPPQQRHLFRTNFVLFQFPVDLKNKYLISIMIYFILIVVASINYIYNIYVKTISNFKYSTDGI